MELISEPPSLGLETLLHKPAFLQLSPDGSDMVRSTAQPKVILQASDPLFGNPAPATGLPAHRFNQRIFQNLTAENHRYALEELGI